MPGPRRPFAAGVLVVLALAARPASSAEYQVVDEKGHTVKGTVRYEGPRPEAAKIVPKKDPSVCTPHTDLSLVVGEGGALANAVVWLDGVTRGKPLAVGKTVIDQKGCVYTPRVQAVAVGSQIAFRNSDATFHNVHAYEEPDGGTAFNLAMPRSSSEHVRTVDTPGLLSIKCDAGHSWMIAWVWAFEHPYFAVTGADGTFTMTDVPAGTHRVKVWHETLGELTGTVHVTAKGAATVELRFRK